MLGPGIVYQGPPVPLAEAAAALPTSPLVPVAFKAALAVTETSLVPALQSHSLYFEQDP